MNKIYQIVWNASLACVQVVSELVSRHTNTGGTRTRSHGVAQRFAVFNLALLPMAVFAAVNPNALPQGAQITQGQGQIQQQGNVLTVKQNSQHLNTQWDSFNIGKDATVNFQQPNRSSVAVNQVLDRNASHIMGRLNANGQVFLLNPNGVIFSKSAQVNVGGLVASTLNQAKYDDISNRFTLSGQANSQARVENHGHIIANGGTVALIAPNVVNTGSIKTHNGVTHLTAANQVTLALQDGSLTQYQIDQGVVQGLVDNQGAIIADNGAVYLTSRGKDTISRSVVNHSGIIEANRLEKNAHGEIILLADMQTGTANVAGQLSAQGMNSQDGGFIETSGQVINIGATAKVTTLAQDGGKTGEWLIDPYNVIISSAADHGSSNVSNTFIPSKSNSVVNVGTLQTALANNNITVTTASAGTEAGDITVDAPITWSANTDLTLSAHNDIHINQNITANHANAGLNLQYGLAKVNAGNTADYHIKNGVKVNLQAGQNFSTQLGSDGSKINYTVITALGSQGSRTATDLQGINGNVAGNYALGADIDASSTTSWSAAFGGRGFDPLGNAISYEMFTGRFDGLGHEINKLYVNLPMYNEAGLFRYVKSGSIRNVNVYDASIGVRNHIGIVAGINDGGSIRNVNTSGNLYVLNNNGDIKAGGVVGQNLNGTISGAHANVSWQSKVALEKNDVYLGGVVGDNIGSITDASGQLHAVVNITEDKDVYVGGLVGRSTGAISNSDASGDVVINHTYQGGFLDGIYAGGLVGHSTDAISNSHAMTTIKANTLSTQAYAGGLIGWHTGNTSKSFATGTVTVDAGNAAIGGLVGVNNGGIIDDSHATGAVTATATKQLFVGGLVGATINGSGSISHSHATGTVSGHTGSSTASVGGLVGHNRGHSINHSYATGLVTGGSSQANTYVGGLVGENLNGANITGSHATGHVTGKNNVGGLIGINNFSGNVSNAYASGDVIGTHDQVGGFVGYNKLGRVNTNISKHPQSKQM